MNENLRRIAKEIIFDMSIAKSIRDKICDIFFPANVMLIKAPLAEYDVVHDQTDRIIVLSCRKLNAVLDRAHETHPLPEEYHWQFVGSTGHPDRKEYRYMTFEMREGKDERKESGTITRM